MSGGDRMYRIRDNNFGTQGTNRFDHRSFGTNVTSQPEIHKAFPQIPTDDLDEWYFICATFNPNIVEPDYNDTLPMFRQNTQYWLNHVRQSDGQIVSNSGVGAKCKVEIISRSELLNARGYIGKPLTVVSKLEEEITQTETEEVSGIPPTAEFGYEKMAFGPTEVLDVTGE